MKKKQENALTSLVEYGDDNDDWLNKMYLIIQ